MKLGIIIGSSREGRSTDRAAKWAATAAKELNGVEVTTLDLRDYDLPMFNEAVSPQYNPERKPEGAVKQWLEALAAQDAFIIVTPEYNRSIPAVLKNAIDYVAYELDRKPVGIIAHGSANGGQAISHLRGIIPGALGISVPRAVAVTVAGHAFDENGVLNPELAANPYGPAAALKVMLADLIWYADALIAAKK
jgi:NAD(P)H-dependent FMN reductase